MRRPVDGSPSHVDCLGELLFCAYFCSARYRPGWRWRPGISRLLSGARIVRRMGIRWPRLFVLGFAVALVTAISGCSSSPLRLVTSDIPERSGMEALLRGTLAVDEDGCVYAKTAGDPVTLVWPKGYTVEGDSGSFDVLDASKNFVARSGSALAIGGGGADSFSDAWAERGCVKGRLWMVGNIGTA